MRGWAVAMILAAWAGQASAGSPSETISPEEAHSGCMHTDLRPCVISLGSVFWFDMKLVAAEIAKRNELDVNGRTAHRGIFIDASVPGHHERIAITLTLASPAPNDLVVKTEITLPEDPEFAHTESEYDRTRLYDVVSVLLGKRCPDLDKLALYRFYENSLKSREVVKNQVLKKGMLDYTKQSMSTDKVPFCGAMFSLRREAELNGTPDFPGKGTSTLTAIDIE